MLYTNLYAFSFDVSILEIGDGTFEVISTAGDNKLGGDDWDDVLVKFIIEEIKKEHNIDLSNDKMAMQRFKDAAEKAKIDLSGMLQTTIMLPFLTMTPTGPVNFETTITRAKFQDMTRHLLERTEGPVRQALKDAKIDSSKIDEILLVGGSTRMPAVVEMVKNLLGKEPNKSVNPDEAVSIGAAVQGAIIAGDVTDVLLLDVTPLTLGIETLGGVMTPLITRNTTIPVTKSQVFSTAEDNQPAVDIVVYQGERPMARDNKLLGNFQLSGIKPARRGEPRIEVTFSIDANGIVNVKAKDLDTNKEQSITITSSSGLSKEDIDRMVKEAEANKEADEKRREEVELKNKAEQYISEIDNAMATQGDKMDPNQKEQTQKLRDELQTALTNNDIETLRKRICELEQADQQMYQYQQQQNANNGSVNPDDPIDADYSEKN